MSLEIESSESKSQDEQDLEPILEVTSNAAAPSCTSYALAMLTVAYIFNFADRTVLGVIQESIKKDLNLTDTKLGILSGFSFGMVYVTAGLPISYAADHWNRRNIIVLSVATWSFMTTLSGVAWSYPLLLFARLGVAIGEAGGTPPALSMISDLFSPQQRTTKIAIYCCGPFLGIAVGNSFGGYTAAQLGWRASFFVLGIPGMMFAIIFRLTVQEPIRGYWDHDQKATHKPNIYETLLLLQKMRSFWLACTAGGFVAVIGYGNGGFFASFLIRNHGMTPGHVGLLLAGIGVTSGPIGMFLAGRIGDKLFLVDRRWLLWLPAISSAMYLLVALPCYLHSNVFVVAVSYGVGNAIGFSFVPLLLSLGQAMVPPSMRALMTATFYFILNLLGMGGGPLAVGMISDLLKPIYGDDSLRRAMFRVHIVASCIGAFMFLLASQGLNRDFKALEASSNSTQAATHGQHVASATACTRDCQIIGSRSFAAEEEL